MRWLKSIFIIGFVCEGLNAANIPITIVGTTQTQIIINYNATTSAACTLTAVDNNNGPTVVDVSSSLFTNANQDLSRTVANGFRWPTSALGLNRTVTIGTHDQIKLGLDGRSYSTSLQTNSNHTITVSCNGGVDVGTITATTANVPFTSNYPETDIVDNSQVTFGIEPTIDWQDSSVKYVDPITGIVIKRITGKSDNFDDTNPFGIIFSTPVIDVQGSAWTTPNNFITNQNSGALAVTSTVGATIFAPLDPNGYAPVYEPIGDSQITPYGFASTTTASLQWCISMNSGQSCANFTPQNAFLSTNTLVYSGIPSSFPSSGYSSWGGMKTWFGSDDFNNKQIAGVSCSGSTCTIDSPAGLQGGLSGTIHRKQVSGRELCLWI